MMYLKLDLASIFLDKTNQSILNEFKKKNNNKVTLLQPHTHVRTKMTPPHPKGLLPW